MYIHIVKVIHRAAMLCLEKYIVNSPVVLVDVVVVVVVVDDSVGPS